MRKIAVLAICLLLHTIAVVAQGATHAAPIVQVVFEMPATNRSAIYYNPTRPLRFADFKGPVDTTNPVSAVTFANIGLGLSIHTANGQKTVKINLSIFFDNSKSWMLPSQLKNDALLAHEQLHFDITAIIACNLKEKLSTTIFTNAGVQQEVETIYNQAVADLHTRQEQYDVETAHGLIDSTQVKWKSNVAAQLAAQHCF